MTITEDGEIITPFLRSAFNYDMDHASLLSGLYCTDETRTQQQFAEEVDINNIVEKFGLTGELPQNLHVPMVGDFTEVYDYQTSLELIRRADEAFMQMPASIREQFGNDPGRFVEYTSNPANVEWARKHGLAVPGEPVQTAPGASNGPPVIPGVQEGTKKA